MNTEQFAVLFGQYIHNKLEDRLLEGDKISLISHSQGGLVSLIWYFNAYLQHHNIAQESVAAIGLYWESDVAVPLPVARFDSIYTVDRNENYVHGQVSGIEKTQKSDFAPLLIINSIHASPNAKLFPDMVEVPRTCLLSINCPHPYLQLISRREPQLKTSSLISG